MSSRSTKAALITYIVTSAMMMCGSPSRLNSKWLFLAATRITLSIPATISIFASFAFTKIDRFLKWNSHGPNDGELTFVSGSPGKTDRQLTMAELADRRDRAAPYALSMFKRREVLLLAYSERSFDNARKARDDLLGDQNNRKRYNGYLAGLLDPQIWSALQAREQKLRAAITRDPKLRSTSNAYDRIK